ncbi:MAG TPA: DUF3349 domain-containing protein [Dermatophilaceae bacterium]|jgi:hypothetical protein|nr:DUF3349 domain-containing protein [Dermatophilaceae bacterium]HPV80446.1 DUF3349 domain-containing protein [Dermatophilaceae bacterium]HPZ69783.1 DUF3349 domain-containing protein [Dermatophilaceae bacterium]HQD02628.1 DUF3349 domain-containing protein [Dermatophilaceae bacterium]
MGRYRGILRFALPGSGARPTTAVPLIALLGRRLSDQEVTDLEETLAERARARGCDSLAEIDLVIAITLLTDELPTTRDIDRVRDALGRRGLTVQRRVPQPT